MSVFPSSLGGLSVPRHVDARGVTLDANLDQEAVFPCFKQCVCSYCGVPFVDNVLPVGMVDDSRPSIHSIPSPPVPHESKVA